MSEYYPIVDALTEVPEIRTLRLRLDALQDRDQAAYNALCLDDERNRWWGYDYREDLKGDLTPDWFIRDARRDFALHEAINWAIRLEDICIGEVILYNKDGAGTMELGCRVTPEQSGHGYGTEAFSAALTWSLQHLGLTAVRAKCYHENRASLRMLASCMEFGGQDDTYFYFVKYPRSLG